MLRPLGPLASQVNGHILDSRFKGYVGVPGIEQIQHMLSKRGIVSHSDSLLHAQREWPVQQALGDSALEVGNPSRLR
jgi:hypothetical protein